MRKAMRGAFRDNKVHVNPVGAVPRRTYIDDIRERDREALQSLPENGEIQIAPDTFQTRHKEEAIRTLVNREFERLEPLVKVLEDSQQLQSFSVKEFDQRNRSISLSGTPI